MLSRGSRNKHPASPQGAHRRPPGDEAARPRGARRKADRAAMAHVHTFFSRDWQLMGLAMVFAVGTLSLRFRSLPDIDASGMTLAAAMIVASSRLLGTLERDVFRQSWQRYVNMLFGIGMPMLIGSRTVFTATTSPARPPKPIRPARDASAASQRTTATPEAAATPENASRRSINAPRPG